MRLNFSFLALFGLSAVQGAGLEARDEKFFLDGEEIRLGQAARPPSYPTKRHGFVCRTSNFYLDMTYHPNNPLVSMTNIDAFSKKYNYSVRILCTLMKLN